MYGLKIGDVVRRRELHSRFGGQRQGGIATPSGPNPILVFTGGTGGQNGYNDGWDGGVFCFFGEGQLGPMDFVRGNRALRDHAKDGKDILLFSMVRKGFVRFEGAFFVASWEHRYAPDREGRMRQAIVFHLAPGAPLAEEEPRKLDGTNSLAELRRMALEQGAAAPNRSVAQAMRTLVQRSDAVRSYALERAAGKCECCVTEAPFARMDGSPYLEVHHLNRLTDGGPDLPDAVAAVCPNCHRLIHHGRDGKSINGKLRASIASKEKRLAQDFGQPLTDCLEKLIRRRCAEA